MIYNNFIYTLFFILCYSTLFSFWKINWRGKNTYSTPSVCLCVPSNQAKCKKKYVLNWCRKNILIRAVRHVCPIRTCILLFLQLPLLFFFYWPIAIVVDLVIAIIFKNGALKTFFRKRSIVFLTWNNHIKSSK